MHPSREDSATYPCIQAFFHWENHNKSYFSAASVQTAVLKHHGTHFPFSPRLLLHFKHISAEYLLNICSDGTNALLRAYCSHMASVPSPSHPPTPRHTHPNHKSTREAQFYLRPSQKPLSGACRACLQVCMEIHSPAVQLTKKKETNSAVSRARASLKQYATHRAKFPSCLLLK